MEFHDFTQQDYWNMLPISQEQRKAIYDDLILTGKYDKIELNNCNDNHCTNDDKDNDDKDDDNKDNDNKDNDNKDNDTKNTP